MQLATFNATVEAVNKPFDLSDYILPDATPFGFQTVAGWWVEREPEAMELLENPVATFFGDAEKLQTICEERGLPFYWVKASRAFNAVGLAEARAFPQVLLAEFYPQNP